MQTIAFTQDMVMGFGNNLAAAEGTLYLSQSIGTYFVGEASVVINGARLDLPDLIDIVGPDSPFFMTQHPEDTCQDPLS